MEDDDQDRGDDEIREGVEALERERERSKHGETTHDQTRGDMWMNMFLRDTRCNTLSHAGHVKKDDMCVQVCEKIRGVRVFCSHAPSVTVDRYQL